MLLKDLLHGWVDLTDESVWLPGDKTLDDVDVISVASDHRECAPGALFACVRGERVDGHDKAIAAVENGALALLVEHRVAGVSVDIPQIVVESVRSMIGGLAARLLGDPSSRMSVVGVTGTNGKTTVTYLLESMARAAGREVGVIGTLGARWGSETKAAGFTTPEAPVLQQIFASMRAAGVTVVAAEVSSHALDYFRVDGTEFTVVGFTNLSSEHLDLHGDIEKYFSAKVRLFTKGFSGAAVVCVDDVAGERLAVVAKRNGLQVRTVSIDSTRHDVDVVAKDVAYGTAGATFVALSPDCDLPITTQLVGSFNVANALVAIELARAIGIDDRSIADGLSDVPQVPGRMQLVDNQLGLTVVVDYAHTPHALETVLTTLRDLVNGGSKLVAVYGCGGDRDRSKRPLMGQAVERFADVGILTSDNPRSESPESITNDVLAGLATSARIPEVILDRKEAIRRALEVANDGDVVLIAGKGHETGQTAKGVTTEFDDRIVAAEILREMAGRTWN